MQLSLFNKAIRVALLASFVFGGATILFATTYYVDPSLTTSDDNNAGTSPTTAWKTLNRVCRYIGSTANSACVTLAPGDQLLLKSGSVFDGGQIYPNANSIGTAQNPIIIDKYGTGAKPKIICRLGADEPSGVPKDAQTNGTDNGAAIVLKQIWGYQINNLELTCPLGMGGIRVFVNNGAVGGGAQPNYYHFKNLIIHDVNGPVVPAKAPFFGGIIFKQGWDGTHFDDIIIDSCEVYDINWIGIQTSYWSQIDAPNRFTNFIIRNTKVHDIGQLGIILRNIDAALIEYSSIYRTGLSKNQESFGVRLKYSTGSKIQYCEAYENYSFNTSGEGGQGFTFDGAAVACTLQYSYSHNNLGGFMSVISDPGQISSNNVIRYNISQNDSNQTFWFGVAGSNPSNTSIYNNTIYAGSSVALSKVVTYESGSSTTFKNNIFYINTNASYDAGPTWDHNCFFGSNTSTPNDLAKITTDPLINAAGTAGVGLLSANVYLLKPGSSCINAGVTIASNGGKDFWGNAVPAGSLTDIGAYEGAGVNGTQSITAHPAYKARQGNLAEIQVVSRGIFTVRNLTYESISVSLFNLNGTYVQQILCKAQETACFSVSQLSAKNLIAEIRAGERRTAQMIAFSNTP